MALKITGECINCDVCEPQCPNQAISMGEDHYEIAWHACTECVGHHEEPQCVLLCPVECIVPDDAHLESQEALLLKFKKLTNQTSE